MDSPRSLRVSSSPRVDGRTSSLAHDLFEACIEEADRAVPAESRGEEIEINQQRNEKFKAFADAIK